MECFLSSGCNYPLETRGKKKMMEGEYSIDLTDRISSRISGVEVVSRLYLQSNPTASCIWRPG